MSEDLIFSEGGFPVITKFLFDGLIRDAWNNDMRKMKSTYPMDLEQKVNAKGDIEGYSLKYALAGFDKNEISVNIEDNILVIKASKEEEEETNYLRKGISYKDMEAKYQLMDGVDKEKIKVNYKNGLLEVYIPLLTKQIMSKSIEIE